MTAPGTEALAIEPRRSDAGGDPFTPMFPRLLHFGVPWSDLRRAADAGAPEGFARHLAERADRYADAGERAVRQGRTASAVASLRTAAACYHYAQLRLPFGRPKERLRGRCRQSYARLAPLLEPAAERVELPCQGAVLPGYLRCAAPGAPCVVLVNGLDSAKEVELDRFGELFLRRGCSTLALDGPGQGELAGAVYLGRPRFEVALSAVVDRLLRRTPPPAAVGVFGVSFGGHLACRAAAADRRLAACVCLGGFFDATPLGRLPDLGREALERALGPVPLAEAVGLEPFRGALDCPLLIVHGGRDHLVSRDQVTLMRSWAAGEVELRVYEDAEHVCTDRFPECLPPLADWLAERLARARRGAQ